MSSLKSIFWQIINVIIKIILELFIFNKKIRRILKGNWAKTFLRKYVNRSDKLDVDVINLLNSVESKNDLASPSKIIWQYWESSDGTIPPLVQACLNSVEKYKGDYQRVLLNPNNIDEYVIIPKIFKLLKRKGIIKTAFFSDILRCCLLIQNGGVWIDATVLLTDYIPKCILESNLFVFQNDLKADLDGLNMASYFIVAKPKNKILIETLNALVLYWKENRFLVNYFTFLHVFTMITQQSKENKDIFKNVPFFSFMPVQHFQSELLESYREHRWDELKKASWIHKLTHKQSVLTKEKNLKTDGTFYQYLIEEYVGEQVYEN